MKYISQATLTKHALCAGGFSVVNTIVLYLCNLVMTSDDALIFQMETVRNGNGKEEKKVEICRE